MSITDNMNTQKLLTQLETKLARQLQAVETTKANIALIAEFAKNKK